MLSSKMLAVVVVGLMIFTTGAGIIVSNGGWNPFSAQKPVVELNGKDSHGFMSKSINPENAVRYIDADVNQTVSFSFEAGQGSMDKNAIYTLNGEPWNGTVWAYIKVSPYATGSFDSSLVFNGTGWAKLPSWNVFKEQMHKVTFTITFHQKGQYAVYDYLGWAGRTSIEASNQAMYSSVSVFVKSPGDKSLTVEMNSPEFLGFMSRCINIQNNALRLTKINPGQAATFTFDVGRAFMDENVSYLLNGRPWDGMVYGVVLISPYSLSHQGIAFSPAMITSALSFTTNGKAILPSWNVLDVEKRTDVFSITFNQAGLYMISGLVGWEGSAPIIYPGQDACYSVEVDVEVPNVAPVANFSFSASNLTVQFNDSSTDSDNDTLTYSWQFGDGTNSTDKSPSHIYSAYGDYTVSLTVSDGKLANVKTQTVTLVQPVINSAPTAAFSYLATDLVVQFTDTSTDPDGNLLTYSWDFGDGKSDKTSSPSHEFKDYGSYSVQLTVSDGSLTSTLIQTITLTEPVVNNPPTASFTFVATDLLVQFTDLSSDTDLDPLTYLWDFGDGSISADQSPSHTYASYETFTVQLTVNDGQSSPTVSQEVTLTAPPPPEEVL